MAALLRRQVARTARRLKHGRPTLSIVVLAAGGDPGRVHSTLSAVRDQASPAIEILVVGYDGGLDAGRAAAGDDTRARFFTAGTAAQARALGVRRSRGGHVLIAAAGDAYPAGALADLLPALGPGETLLLGDRVDSAEPADLVSRPDAARQPRTGRLVVPRAALAAALAADAADDPDGVLVAIALLRAGFGTAPYPAYRDARSERSGPFLARIDPLPYLAAHLTSDRASLAALSAEQPAREQRALGALVALRPFLEVAEVAAPDQWAALTTHARELRDLAADQLESVPVVPRALALLAADGRREDLVRLVAARRTADDFATEVLDGRVIADLGVTLPADALVVGEDESPLAAQARRLYVEDGSLVLEVLAGVRKVSAESAPLVEARLVDGDRIIALRVEVGADPAVTRWFAEAEHDHDHGLLTLRAALADLAAGAWEIELEWAGGALRRTGMVQEIARHGSASRGSLGAGPDLSVRLRGRHGRVALLVEPGSVPASGPVSDGNLFRVEADGDVLRLTVDRAVERVWLEGSGRSIDAVPGSAGFWTLVLADDPWGLGVRPLSSGGYRLKFATAGTPVGVHASPGLVDLLPTEWHTGQHRIALHGAVLRLDPLLAPDEIGSRAQRRLRAEHAQITETLDERLVYFQSFTGQWANDNPLAIQAELVRRRPDLDIRWLVADSSTAPPPGSRPVLFRSREWYDVLARASYLVTNIELERSFSPRPGQQILQTFHGYPSKAMGLGLWTARGLLPSHIAAQLEHTSGVWNTLVTPDPEMDQYYRRDYAYDGRILPLGYPRNDVLVGTAGEQLRLAARARLGIAEHQRAVLYAPTWRDDLATNYRAAEAVHHLDVHEAAAALGDDYVLLMRGHRFHAPTAGSGSRVIDVTAYPDINHLIAAADVGVLDYSSLRFDFALTGRPMVFLVPDLETYGSRTRGFLWDYRETAPGPMLATTAEVVAMLKDLDSLRTSTAADLAAFNTRYNSWHDGHAAERVVSEFFAPLL